MPTDNRRSPARPSSARGDPYAAFERLPPRVRAALAHAVSDWCPIMVSAQFWPISSLGSDAGLKPDEVAALYVERFHQAEDGEVLQFSNRHKRDHKRPSPHVAAKASVLRELPLRRGRRRRPWD